MIFKSKFYYFEKVILLFIILILVSCEDFYNLFPPEVINVTNVVVSPERITMKVGEKVEISATISPDNAADDTVSWSSDNPDIASIDSDGIITAIAVGTTTITVTTTDGGFTAESELIVIENRADICIVSFNTMGGTAIEDIIVQIDNTIYEPTKPVLDNFIFNGWYRDDYFDEEWDFNMSIVEEDIILYSKWTEVFAPEDKPAPQVLSCLFINDEGETILTAKGESIERTCKLQTPWNYEKDYNANRDYPLVISLHGWTSISPFYYDPASLFGSTNMREFPCFFLAPSNPWSEDCEILDWDDDNAAWVRNIVHDLISSYRIDTDRIYVIGFSMGGSGSYYFVEDLYADGIVTAGIVRCAGMSYSDLPAEIAEMTSVWYNVGLEDDALMNNVADAAYEYMKNLTFFDDATETIIYDEMYGYERKTSTLAVDNIQAMKYSKYTGLGHSSVPVWQDPFTLKWLFHQSLEDR